MRERFDPDLRRNAARRESSLFGYERIRERGKDRRAEGWEGEGKTAFGEKSVNRDATEIEALVKKHDESSEWERRIGDSVVPACVGREGERAFG